MAKQGMICLNKLAEIRTLGPHISNKCEFPSVLEKLSINLHLDTIVLSLDGWGANQSICYY